MESIGVEAKGSIGIGARPVARRCLRRTGLRALAVAVVVAVVAALLPSVAVAQEQVPVGNVQIVSPLQQETTVVITEVGDVVSTVGGSFMKSGCFDSEVGTSCIGDTTSEGTLNIGGSRAPIKIEGGAIERQRLQWMIDEAVTYVAALYDVPIDERIERYAAPEIRAYMINRILNIIDKAAYNQTLDPDEASTLEFIQQQVLDVDRKAAIYAYDEYQRFKSLPCGYGPPAAPAFVSEPVGIPADVVSYCETAHHPLAVAFDFMPPQPSESHFTTWGVYRQMSELGLASLNVPTLQASMTGTIAAIRLIQGIGLAAASSFLIGGAVGASVVVSKALLGVLAPFALRAITAAAKVAGVAAAPYIAGAAAGLVVGAAAIVLEAIVLIVISSWMFADYQKVGTNLSDAANNAKAATDPFGLAALQAANQGKEFLEGMDADNLPVYRQEHILARLIEMVTRWMTVGLGGAQPDATGVWDPTSTSFNRDWTWEVTDSAGTRQQVVLLHPLPEGGRGTVRFDRGWMVVTDFPNPPHGELQFVYETPDGETAVVTRRPDGGFLVSILRLDEDGSTTLDEPFAAESIQFRHPDTGELVTARLIAPGTLPALGGPRPTVAGTFVPGWVHNLRPNPVDVNGNFDLGRFRQDYDFEWELERFDETTQAWVDVALLDPPAGERVYGAKFLPTVTGAYRARVTMTSLVDPLEPEATGMVGFEIVPPVIAFDEAVLVDDGFSSLRLDLHLSQNTGGGNLAVAVRWPGDLGSEDAPHTTVDIECLPLTPATCDTPRTANVPVLAQALTHELGPMSDISAGVQVTVTNDHGGTVTRTLAIDSTDRPRFAPPPVPPGPDQSGSVVFDTNITDVQIPAAAPGGSPNYLLATIVAGASDDPGSAGFSIYDPVTGTVSGAILLAGNPRLIASVFQQPDGRWVLGLFAAPTMQDLGTHIVPIGIQQNNGRRATMLLHLDVVAAPDNKYRARLDSDVDPADIAVDHLPVMAPVVVNGQADWEPYADELCVSLLNTNFPGDPVQKCAPIEEFRGADGTLVFPWADLAPDGIELGIHRARAWLAETDRSWSAPHEVRFFMTSGAPLITDLSWDNTGGQLTLAVEAFSAGAPVQTVTCTLDGVATSCFEPTGGTWAPAGLPDGSHRVEVVVTDTVGNFGSAGLDFVSSPPSTPPPSTPPPSTPPPSSTPPSNSPPPSARPGGPGAAPLPGGRGYFLVETDGDLYGFGAARALLRGMDPAATESQARGATLSGLAKTKAAGTPAVAVESTADGKGLWVLLADGRIVTLGNAPAAKGASAAALTKLVAGQPERPASLARVAGGDLWLFTSAGRIVPQFGRLPAGTAAAMDQVLAAALVGPILDAVPTVDGTGAYATASDGGVFAYNAPFHGSVPGALAGIGRSIPDQPMTGMAIDPDSTGYWLVAADGGVFAFAAPFRGALPAVVPFARLFSPVNGMTSFGNGYLLVAGDGGIFNFSNRPFSGSASGLADTTITDIAPT